MWLCQIAKNCYFSNRKKARKTETLDDSELDALPSAELIEEKIIDRSEAMRIRRALHHIPEPYKEVFMWRVFAELGFRQIGSMFGKSENWACVTYHRARKMIRSRLEEEDSGE